MSNLLHKFFGWVNKNGLLTFTIMALASTVFSTVGFINESTEHNFELIMIGQGLMQSFVGLPTDKNFFLVLGKIFWILTFASAAVSLFLKEWSYKELVASIQLKEHIAIIGVGRLSHVYIEELDKSKTVIFNVDDGGYANAIKESGFAVQNIDLVNIYNKLKIKNITHMVINTGTDLGSIDAAFQVIEQYVMQGSNHSLMMIVRIENRELNNLLKSSTLFNAVKNKANKIQLKTYSFYQECASALFQDNFIDGDDNAIIDSNDEYSIIIAGNGILANQIVYEAAKTAHLPNENKLNIYLTSDDAEAFKKSLIKSYPGIEKIPTLELYIRSLNYTTLDYFTDNVWHIKNLTNVIICHDDENINLGIAASLKDKTYLRDQDMKIKVLFGVFDQANISNIIEKDSLHYPNFKPFGNAKKILNKENVFDDTNNQIAKFINYTYDGLTEKGAYSSRKTLHNKLADVNDNWFRNANFEDKLSSLAQAEHIKMKLKALGLKAEKSIQDKEKLLEINRQMLDCKFDIDYKGNYGFPENFNATLFDRMLRMEHNRWNAFHYLNGWEYKHYFNQPKDIKNKMKAIKLHNCLLPIEEFRTTQFLQSGEDHESELIKLIEWDIYSFMYIPNYLASARYEILAV